MTHDSQELLNLFGRLFAQPGFNQAAILSRQIGGHHEGERGQLRVLRLLATHDKLTNAELVEALDIRPSSVSALVTKLEGAGLISRTPAEDDKRVSLISLTDEGRQLINDSRTQKDQLSEALFDALDPTEQAQLAGLLRKLTAGLDENPPQIDPAYFQRLAHLRGHRQGFDRSAFDRDGFGPGRTGFGAQGDAPRGDFGPRGWRHP
ncbi:MarR family winged helix-turn-helix transcriptional regulator [Lacticaseibacillus daqingensis]|uniref:MarR family winged helix-turn-helix transcriptional regulator n=1 Tax=Lacticaseibacillus daqingensis TaxID=2486014 RepID=UPI000F78F768|nr:MarR family transcriptional regulator [Lacticaseibacillus daqingensis]